jgi:hypothetical protein
MPDFLLNVFGIKPYGKAVCKAHCIGDADSHIAGGEEFARTLRHIDRSNLHIGHIERGKAEAEGSDSAQGEDKGGIVEAGTSQPVSMLGHEFHLLH